MLRSMAAARPHPIVPAASTALAALALSAAALALSACGSDPRPPAQRTPFSGEIDPSGATLARERDAEQALNELDATISASQVLEPPAAFARQASLAPRIDAAVERCAGTRFENKAVYLQAQWRFQFNDDGSGVDASLDRLDGLEKSTLKLAGKALRVQHLLREGRLVSARTRAEQIVAGEPAFGYLLDLARWHERIGGIVDITAGTGLDGQAVDPATASEHFLLYLHLATWNDQAAFTTARYLNAIGKADCRLVVVVRDGSPRRVGAELAKMAGREHATALVCATQAETAAMLSAWTPPMDPWTVLLDGKRRIAKVELRPGDLPELLR